MKATLNDKLIRSLKPRDRQYELYDQHTSGLSLRVSSSGSRSFYCLYRFGRKSKRLMLGRYPDLSLADARYRAREAKKEVAGGDDPQAKKMVAREKYKSLLYTAVAKQFIDSYAKPQTRYWRESERTLLRREIVGAWRHTPVTSITRADVCEVLDAVHPRGASAASHAFAEIRRLLNWCKKRGIIEHSPCDGLEFKVKIKSRSRVLSDEELKAVLNAAIQMESPFGSFVQVLVLTLQRRSEVANLRRCDIDFSAGVWTQLKNKSDREHRIFLCQRAIALLEEIGGEPEQLVFKARGRENPISGFSKWKKDLDRLSGVSDWCLHDLRRTATTRMSELGVPIHVCELILNHRVRELDGIAGVYNRNLFEKEQRQALEQWGDFIERLLAGSSPDGHHPAVINTYSSVPVIQPVEHL